MEFWKDLGGGIANPAAAAAFGMARPGLAATNDMVFSTYTPALGWNERLRVTSLGNVGIGTTSPSTKLQVMGDITTSTQYNINNNRVLSVGTSFDSLYVGVNAGGAAPESTFNTFVGAGAGRGLTFGSANSFFGHIAGFSITSGGHNSFFGSFSGYYNTEGSFNSYFGRQAGVANTISDNNSIFGYQAGTNNTAGSNTFVGSEAGKASSTGASNAFFGALAGAANTSGHHNTVIGTAANVSSGSLSYATAIGADAVASGSNSIYLGRADGSDSVRVPGIVRVFGGSDAEPVSGGSIIVGEITASNIAIDDNEIMARNNLGTATLALNADGGNVNLIQGGTGNVGIGTSAPADKLDADGDIRVGTSTTNGCLKNNNGGTITGTCSSDLRFKRNVTPFPSVLKNFQQLRPVNYFWRANDFPNRGFGPKQDYGLIAQDVEKVLPDLVSTDPQGFKQIDYAKLPLLTIQAIKELSAQNETLKARLDAQQKEIDAIKTVGALKKTVKHRQRR